MRNPATLLRWGIFLLGLVVRLALPLLLQTNPAKGDGSIYVQHTENLKHFGVYSTHQQADPVPTYEHMPGLPFLLYATFKIADRHSYWALIPNILCGWGILLVLSAFLCRLGIPDKIRLPALAIYALVPLLDYYAAQFYPTVPAAFLTLTGFYFILRLTQKTHWKWAILAGLFLGLSVHFRPELVVNFLAAAFALLLSKPGIKKLFTQTILLLTPLLLLLTPWTIRNYQLDGRIVPLVRNMEPGVPDDYQNVQEPGCAHGLYAWLNTWYWKESQVKKAAWNFETVELTTLPPTAFANAAELNQIKKIQSAPNYSCALDWQMLQIAKAKNREKPFQRWIILPLKRVFFMLIRTEAPEEYHGKKRSLFWIYAVLSNLIIAGGFVLGILQWKKPPILWAFLAAILMRLAGYCWVHHVEHRYILLYLPLFFVFWTFFLYKRLNTRL